MIFFHIRLSAYPLILDMIFPIYFPDIIDVKQERFKHHVNPGLIKYLLMNQGVRPHIVILFATKMMPLKEDSPGFLSSRGDNIHPTLGRMDGSKFERDVTCISWRISSIYIVNLWVSRNHFVKKKDKSNDPHRRGSACTGTRVRI